MYTIYVDYIGRRWEARCNGCGGTVWRYSAEDRDVAIAMVAKFIGVKRTACKIVDHSCGAVHMG
jgi:hypothetical protein